MFSCAILLRLKNRPLWKVGPGGQHGSGTDGGGQNTGVGATGAGGWEGAETSNRFTALDEEIEIEIEEPSALDKRML